MKFRHLVSFTHICLLTDNYRGGERSLKKFGSRKILVDFHLTRSLVFSAVVCFSVSRFFDKAVSKSRLYRPADLSRRIDFLAFCLLLLVGFCGS